VKRSNQLLHLVCVKPNTYEVIEAAERQIAAKSLASIMLRQTVDLAVKSIIIIFLIALGSQSPRAKKLNELLEKI